MGREKFRHEMDCRFGFIRSCPEFWVETNVVAVMDPWMHVLIDEASMSRHYRSLITALNLQRTSALEPLLFRCGWVVTGHWGRAQQTWEPPVGTKPSSKLCHSFMDPSMARSRKLGEHNPYPFAPISSPNSLAPQFGCFPHPLFRALEP